MPAAIIAVAAVSGGVLTAATVGYIGLGVTVMGMVTKNPKLTKIGTQIGLGAGLGAITNSFMGGAAATATGATANTASSAAGLAGDAASKSVTAGMSALPSELVMQPPQSFASGAGSGLMDAAKIGSAFTNTGSDTATDAAKSAGSSGLAAMDNGMATTKNADMPGATFGTTQGTQNISTPADTAGTYGSFFDRFTSNFKDPDGRWNKQVLLEGGKIAAGAMQGMSRADETNAILEERRRLTDIQLRNANDPAKLKFNRSSLMQRA